MAKRRLLDNVIIATKALKGFKLKTISSSIKPTMEIIKQCTGLDTIEEIMVFVAIFDRQCTDMKSTISDLADYFCCSSMEIMSFVPSLQALQSKGYIKPSNTREKDIKRKAFHLYTNVFNAIVEGKEIKPVATEPTSIDQFGFCYMVHDLLKEREKGLISTKELYAEVEQLEDKHSTLLMVKVMKKTFAITDTRIWFYETCRDFSLDYKGDSTSVNETLKDIYDNIAQGALTKKKLLTESHPLMKKDFIHICDSHHSHDNDTNISLAEKGIRLLYGDAADAYIKKNKCLNKYEFLGRMEDAFDEIHHRMRALDYRNVFTDFQDLEKANQNLSAIANAKKVINDASDRLLFYRICKKLVNSDSFHIRYITDTFPSYMEMGIKRQLKNEQHPLQTQGLVDVIKGNNFFEGATLVLTDKGKELFLEEDVDLFEEKLVGEDIIAPAEIAEKQLFFEPNLEKQLSMLKESLDETKLASIREHLKANNLPIGVATLLYGEPGTGKTESVMQIARATGREIMHVDISQTKSCWFGESEKIIKGVFNRYRKLCEKSKVKPILLFNEADAVFSKRKDSNSSNVAQTENAIQNIILEEIENLEGILIATTNLADNLDSAFERRFLFKVHFDKPTIDSKKHIWKNKMSYLSDEEALDLAACFDFSGGEIDNIVRKAAMEEVLSGSTPNMERIKTLCLQEKIAIPSRKIGF